MRPIGLGIDVIDLRFVRGVLERDAEGFVGWFSAAELSRDADKLRNPNFVAGRIAAKEAVAKALGTGFSDDVSWQDVEINSLASGPPSVTLHAGAASVANEAGITVLLLSISHSRETAVAAAVAVTT